MTRFTQHDDLSGAEFHDTDLRGARFVGADLSGAVMRGVDVAGLEIDAPWLLGKRPGSLVVNGVDVAPLVDAELDRRFPGRSLRGADEPAALQQAWAAAEAAWGAALDRVATMPAGSVEVSVDGEWSFAQTLRHLVMATDTWLGKAVLRLEQPYHPLGLANTEAGEDELDLSVFVTGTPAYTDVLEARADRVARVRDFVAAATSDLLAEQRQNPWAPDHPETVLSCLRTILEEEWEHLRYASRDLDAIVTGA